MFWIIFSPQIECSFFSWGSVLHPQKSKMSQHLGTGQNLHWPFSPLEYFGNNVNNGFWVGLYRIHFNNIVFDSRNFFPKALQESASIFTFSISIEEKICNRHLLKWQDRFCSSYCNRGERLKRINKLNSKYRKNS